LTAQREFSELCDSLTFVITRMCLYIVSIIKGTC